MREERFFETSTNVGKYRILFKTDTAEWYDCPVIHYIYGF